ncbi:MULTISPECIES: phosphodiester glycosidase family protein [Clostridium]|jgi:exopolysaccharide biosynthesis protein|uniref:Exopolysaccharide biosynthesis protein n=2 Tax=Clostridium saccharoperbutylacetonicum TaxID=36745 RepID=M1LPT6_9CLOT|nr:MULTISPECIES: phosphodiester glycosidase family protein [Clostridium]AGF54875.1 exopolysaccharide biosynthesis protein [Clostridium saccharoperbutylacetonicum N1-4(HMT)]AQR93796.1 hypothetical protein CLSAP_11030 [Clostridium saccharoperbutylacetonicum]NRT64420.1 exopolysaccharide biosynthesis protein [Clostridium saccharoperbutylacetonicum]NSB29496.1 exopolysaccharide biosynthesis protein [Clostridium saccharoperbutylacetonicum]NSB41276.1 exopolysaccharide biosynthesis protein [Clostridium
MNKNKNINKNVNRKPKLKVKKSKKSKKKISIKTIVMFLVFELIFSACTFPFMILYGPFDVAKSTYVGAAMTSTSYQFMARWFMSDAKIAEIQGQNSVEDNGEKTDLDQINIPKVKDDTIEIQTIEGNSKYSGYYMIVKDPTRVKIGVTSKIGVEGETTSQIAEENGAIAAINGGGFVDQSSTQAWTGNGGVPTGIVMTGGKVKNDDTGGKEVSCLGITKEGKMMVGNYTLDELVKQGVQEAVSFYPALIISGKKLTINGDGGFGIRPKTAIGQKKDGSIILMVIDGNDLGSLGATVKEVQDIMYQLGAYNAINLDGGKSTTMYYDGDIINKPSNSMGERTIATAIIVK